MIHFTTNNNKTNQNTKLGKHILAAAKDQEKTVSKRKERKKREIKNQWFNIALIWSKTKATIT